MALKSTSLVTVAAVKALALDNSALTTWDTLLETIIDGVSDAVNAYCGRVLGKTTYTNLYLDGPDHSTRLLLPNYPIVSLTSIYEDDVLLVEGADNDYQVDLTAGIVHRNGCNWATGIKIIKTTYVAGYTVQDATVGTGETALPADLKLAACEQCAVELQRKTNKSWNEASKSMPDGSISRFDTGRFIKSAREVFDHYRSIVI